MLVQDTLTGAVHEVPESQLYEADYGESPERMAEGQILYDGLGNPVGFSFLKRAFRCGYKAGPARVALAGAWSRSPDPGGPAGAPRRHTAVGSGGAEATTSPSAKRGAAVCPRGASISAGNTGSSAARERRRLLRGGRARPANARAAPCPRSPCNRRQGGFPAHRLIRARRGVASICDASPGEAQRAWSPRLPHRRNRRPQSLPNRSRRGPW